ncbi:Acetyl esterase/lipase [Goodfellowiella coeruleoviolacea]|uniref:Acetyl esterase/lipase n=2 Tax=Goodfellowiella coeruleoviolacea TaxID=334858 RepID=A0AAE3KL77_9PSEU|nr:Acetyl esterase/lipase [Goodfellowiella coeruleoviolacea]
MGAATTGIAEAAETRAFNEQLERQLAERVPLHVLNDAVAARTWWRQGIGGNSGPVELAEGSWRAVPGPDREVPVRVFTPPEVRGVFLHIHGGGFTFGSAGEQDPRLWRLAQRARVAVVSVEYRLAPEHPYPAAHDDCEQVARWLVANAEAEFGTDRLVIGGESAGANLSAATLLRLRDRHDAAGAFLAAQLVFGSYDLSMTPSQRLWGERNLLLSTPTLAWFRENYTPGWSAEDRRDPALSPLYANLTGLPPARFVVGTNDPVLDDSLFMAARWQAAGNAATLDVVAEAPHGFPLFPITVAEQELVRQERFVAAAVA